MLDNSANNGTNSFSLLRKRIISTALTLLLFFGVTAWLMVKQDIDYAKGNDFGIRKTDYIEPLVSCALHPWQRNV